MHDTSSKSYSKYVLRDGQYQMIGATLDSLPCGFYRPFIDGYGNPFLNKQEISMPKLYELPNETQSTILNDVKKFGKVRIGIGNSEVYIRGIYYCIQFQEMEKHLSYKLYPTSLSTNTTVLSLW